MNVIGILGGIASGKTFVAKQFEELGAVVLDVDAIAHHVLAEREVIKALRERWGPHVVNAEGEIDRAAVAELVFAEGTTGSRELDYLERITHPRIGERVQRRLAELAESENVVAVVLDAAVMLKAGWDEFCDRIVFIASSRKQRLERVLQRGWSEADFAAREAAQESLDEKRKHADWVIDNGKSAAHTRAQVRQIWHTLH